MNIKKIITVFKSLGPGLLMAGAAIGVSHIVQATRAGANFGYQLIIIVIIANLLKYPFFEFGHRYAVATGENLLQGYKKIGKGFLIAFLLLNLVTSIGTMAGVSFVTGALAYNLYGEVLSPAYWSIIVLFVCVCILVLGSYKILDFLMKIIMGLLFIATMAAFTMALMKAPSFNGDFSNPSAFTWVTLPFLMALMGWMPAPVETSIWQSLWVQAKNKNQKEPMTWMQAKLDFNFGYVSTGILAIIFLILGALVMNGSGIQFSNSGGAFAAQVVDLYTQNLGLWSKPIIGFVAFLTMFSTTITCLDAYPRSLSKACELIWSKLIGYSEKLYLLGIIWCAVGGGIVIFLLISSLKTLIDFVTIAAFLTAPIFALMNYKLIFSKHLPVAYRPKYVMKVLCWLGLIYLFGFSLFFIYYKLTS